MPMPPGVRARRLARRVGDGLDGVEDLHVAGAAAEVGAEVAGRVVPGEVGALLVDSALARITMPGRAEPALQRAAWRRTRSA